MTDRAEYIKGLRTLADLLEQHPHLGLPYEGGLERPVTVFVSHLVVGGVVRQAVVYAAAMDRPVARLKPFSDQPDHWLEITGSLGGLHVELIFRTAAACERGAGGWVLPAGLRGLVEVAADESGISREGR
ncbi:hypothetical protein [Streptosporangium sp. NPDC004631]